MQKVEGSSPFIRLREAPGDGGFFYPRNAREPRGGRGSLACRGSFAERSYGVRQVTSVL